MKGKWLIAAVVVVMLGAMVLAPMASARPGNNEGDGPYPAAPAVATQLLREEGITRGIGHSISQVARHMGSGATFEGLEKSDDGYKFKVLDYLLKIEAFDGYSDMAGRGMPWTNADTSPAADKLEVLIGFEDAPGRATERFIERQDWEITRELPQINVLLVTLPKLPDEADDSVLDRAAQALDEAPGIPDVKYVEINGLMHAHGQETPWGVERIEAPKAHDTSTGEGVGIAILDTGIDPDHETLEVAGGKAIVSASGSYSEDWADDHGHGTHVAGTAAALANEIGVLGTAPNVQLWAVKVLDNSGSGSFADVAEGIMWAADENKEVINMSLGGGHSDAVEDAVLYAYGEGSLMVASAGNDGNHPVFSTVNYPAAYEQVIAVSATDKDDDIAGFSSRGPEVELAAPGVDILSTLPDDEYEEWNGTSMAAPHVAGVAALVFDILGLDASNDEPKDVDEVRKHLQDTAEDIGLEDDEQGHGLVNAAEAVGVEEVGEPDVETLEASEVTDTSVVLRGELKDLGDADSVEVWFKWGENESLDDAKETDKQTLNDTGTFEDTIVELEPETTYYFRAMAENDAGIDEGEVEPFTTEGEEDLAKPTMEKFEIVNTRTTGPWFRVYVEWEVSHEDDALYEVKTELLDGGDVVDTRTTSVSGGSASGEHELRTRGNADAVRLTVTDTAGQETEDTENIE